MNRGPLPMCCCLFISHQEKAVLWHQFHLPRQFSVCCRFPPRERYSCLWKRLLLTSHPLARLDCSLHSGTWRSWRPPCRYSAVQFSDGRLSLKCCLSQLHMCHFDLRNFDWYKYILWLLSIVYEQVLGLYPLLLIVFMFDILHSFNLQWFMRITT